MKNEMELIQSRARRLAPYLADFLQNEDSADFDRGQTYKFTYLILKGPRKYFEQFQYGEMQLDRESIQSIYWMLREEIPGPGQLLEAEERILANHNSEVVDYWNRQQRPKVNTYGEQRVIGLSR